MFDWLKRAAAPFDARERGVWGEDRAEKYLKKKGWRIIGRNVRYKCGELDIVATDGDEVVFVEVKARKSGNMVTAAEAVDRAKARRLIRAANIYLQENGLTDRRARFDVIAIDGENIGHIVSAFDTEYPRKR